MTSSFREFFASRSALENTILIISNNTDILLPEFLFFFGGVVLIMKNFLPFFALIGNF